MPVDGALMYYLPYFDFWLFYAVGVFPWRAATLRHDCVELNTAFTAPNVFSESLVAVASPLSLYLSDGS